MARGVTVKVEGLRELEKALTELPKSTGKAVLRRVARMALEPFAADMKARAPDDPATSGNDLRSSIGIGTRLSKRQGRLHRKAFRDDRASIEMFAGAGAVPHAHLTEYGGPNNVPVGYGRAAWDANKAQMPVTIRKELATEINKAVKRLARKAAKLAAKG